MKEYKVITPKLGITNRNGKLENTLNQYARERWVVNFIATGAQFIVFEREKNL